MIAVFAFGGVDRLRASSFDSATILRQLGIGVGPESASA
jgi:hypothetical protein